jgi:hypothetical protein
MICTPGRDGCRSLRMNCRVFDGRWNDCSKDLLLDSNPTLLDYTLFALELSSDTKKRVYKRIASVLICGGGTEKRSWRYDPCANISSTIHLPFDDSANPSRTRHSPYNPSPSPPQTPKSLPTSRTILALGLHSRSTYPTAQRSNGTSIRPILATRYSNSSSADSLSR